MKTVLPSISSPPAELQEKPNKQPCSWRGCDNLYPISNELDTVAATKKESPCKLCMDIDIQHKLAIEKQQPVKQAKEVQNMNVIKPTSKEELEWRRPCGCLKTSDKLKELLKCFPAPLPPPPQPPSSPVSHISQATSPSCSRSEKMCIAACCTVQHEPPKSFTSDNKALPPEVEKKSEALAEPSTKVGPAKLPVRIMKELVQLLQLSVTATALALYYIIYFYMQLVYFMLRSAMFFHNADGPMKITIGVVTVTSLIICFNLLLRLEKVIGMKLGEWWA